RLARGRTRPGHGEIRLGAPLAAAVTQRPREAEGRVALDRVAGAVAARRGRRRARSARHPPRPGGRRASRRGPDARLAHLPRGAGSGFEAQYLARVAALTPGIVREAGERRIDPGAAVACAILPEGDGIDSEGLSTLLLEAEEAARKAPRAPPSPRPPEKREPIRFAEPRTGPLLREPLPGGGALLVKEERAVPLVALRAVWPGGLRAESDADCGVNMLLARLAAKGTRSRGAIELAREFEAMGGSIGGNSGRNSFGVRAEMLSR